MGMAIFSLDIIESDYFRAFDFNSEIKAVLYCLAIILSAILYFSGVSAPASLRGFIHGLIAGLGVVLASILVETMIRGLI